MTVITEQDARDILEHFGVKGMKWGVRRSRAELDAAGPEAIKKAEVLARVQKNKGSTASISNADLQAAITRMGLEKKFREVRPLSRSEKNKALVNKLIKDAGNREIEALKKGQVGPIMKALDGGLSRGGAHKAPLTGGKHKKK